MSDVLDLGSLRHIPLISWLVEDQGIKYVTFIWSQQEVFKECVRMKIIFFSFLLKSPTCHVSVFFNCCCLLDCDLFTLIPAVRPFFLCSWIINPPQGGKLMAHLSLCAEKYWQNHRVSLCIRALHTSGFSEMFLASALDGSQEIFRKLGPYFMLYGALDAVNLFINSRFWETVPPRQW